VALFKSKKAEPVLIGQASVVTRGAGMSVVHHENFIEDDEHMADRIRAASTISAWAWLIAVGVSLGRSEFAEALHSDLFDANAEADSAESWEAVEFTLAPELLGLVAPKPVTLVSDVFITPDNGVFTPWQIVEDQDGLSTDLLRIAALALYEQSLRTMNDGFVCSVLFAGMRILYGFGSSQEQLPRLVEDPSGAARAIYAGAVNLVAEELRNG
jgi:hypothetical protein